MSSAAVSLVPGSDAWRQLYTSTKVVDLVQGRQLKVFNQMMGIGPQFAGNERTRWGQRLEPVILAAAAEQEGWTLTHPGTVIDPENPKLATTPDAVANDAIAVDAKNRAADQAHKYAAGDATEGEHIQACWHAGILRLSEYALAVLIGGNDLHVWKYPFDAETFEGCKEIVARFDRDHIQTGTPPAMDASDAAADYLRARFPKETGPVLTADDLMDDAVSAYRRACQEFDAAEERKSVLGNRLREAIGAAAGVKGVNYSVSYKASKPSVRTDWEAVVKALGVEIPADVLAACSVTKPGARSLRVTFKGE